MPSTYELISSTTLVSAAASYTFTAIPSTFTDLVIRYSARGTSGGWNYINLTFNGNTSSVYSHTYLMGNGSSASSSRSSNQTSMQLDTNTIPSQDTNIFNNSEYYIPNYLSTTAKPLSAYAVGDRNNAEAYITATAGLANVTSAITSIKLENLTSNFVAGSSFYLYGVKNS
jgi:hypothetical protein